MKQLLVELASFDYVSCIVDSETRKVQWGKGFRETTFAKRQKDGAPIHPLEGDRAPSRLFPEVLPALGL
jgi:hypothetical protein